MVTLIAYLGFVVYATYRVLQPWIEGAALADYAGYYVADNGVYHYLSPMGTPDLTFLVPGLVHALPIVGAILHSPAAVILPFPALFRFTCYYYRKSYYRAFVARPYACAVPAAKGWAYQGERGLLMLQNLHRYFLYAAIVITFFLAYDALLSVFTPHGLYFGLGSALMVLNVVLLTFYTYGCHSFRHLVGGKLDCFSCDAPTTTRYKLWTKVTVLNGRHALWAWTSLLTVWGVDVYIVWVKANPGLTHILGVIPV